MNSRKLRTYRTVLLCAVFVSSAFLPRSGLTQDPSRSGQTVDTTVSEAVPESVPAPTRPRFVFSPFDTASYNEILMRHAFSLDHYFEAVPGFVLGRFGPIGADMTLSRYGMGGGRTTVIMAGVPINDPQNGIAPLFLFPSSTVQTLVFDTRSSNALIGRAGIEGSVGIIELTPLPDRPFTAIEVSKGRFDLRQRRVRFSSARSSLGIDLGYDELLNDGYQFDTRDLVQGPGYGQSFSRSHTMNVRGNLPDGESFLFSFRWFRRAFQGDLLDDRNESRRSGHFAIASATHRSWRFTLFERGHDASLPDSHTVNQTTGAYATLRPGSGERVDTELGFGFEDILSRQAVAGAKARPKLRVGSFGAVATARAWRKLHTRVEFALSHHHKGKTGWGGRALFFWPLTPGFEISVVAGQSFRLPNLGERFLPLHASGASSAERIVGNKYLNPETAQEVGGRLRSRIRSFHNEIRVTRLRLLDEIAFVPRSVGGETWLIPENGDRRDIGFLEDRWSIGGSLYLASIRLSGGLVYAFGKREGFLSAVPRIRLDTSLSIGRDFFKSSSSLFVSADYQYSGSRRAFPGPESPPYGVFNIRIDARLVDAHLYMQWLNVFDKDYRTVGPYLMTPKTFVYGVQWTIFR